MIEFYHNRIKLGHDKNKRRTHISSIKHVATKIFMSQQTAQQATRIREEKSVATKEFHITIEIAKELKKLCHDKVNRLKRKMFVTIRKIMSRQTLEAEGHEKLVANRFGVTTQYILVATSTRPKFCRNIIKVCRDRIHERAQRTGRDKRLHATIETGDKD